MALHGGMRNALKLAFPELSFSKWGEESIRYRWIAAKDLVKN